MSDDTRKIKVAILGGGGGAMATAFELSETEELRNKYQITVYQQGWRLGGKGASGRNSKMGFRVEEHGLHMMMGFYENAFDLIKRAYQEWNKAPDNPFQTWTDAFRPQNQITLQQKSTNGGRDDWQTWNIPTPPFPGVPGDGKSVSLTALFHAMLKWLFDQHKIGKKVRKSKHRRKALGRIQKAVDAAGSGPHTPAHLDAARKEIEACDAKLKSALTSETTIGQDLSRIALIMELGWTVLKGVIADILPHGWAGFRQIDDIDFRAWLAKHGATDTVTGSAPVRALYDLGFAYEDGDASKPAASAGVALYVMLNIMFRSKGAALYKMNAGMGDTIFTPLYEVLLQRGVKFEFFSRVEKLGLSEDRNLIETIEINRQVNLNPGAENPLSPYNPIVDVPVMNRTKTLPCWPSNPKWELIEDGPAIAAQLEKDGLTLENWWCAQSVETETLKLGSSFDYAVLGISVAGLRSICPDLMAAHPPFRDMVENTGTVQTQSVQLWMNSDLSGLGWQNGTTVMTGYAPSLGSWADMSQLLPMEDWPANAKPGSVEYFCGTLADSETEHCIAVNRETVNSPPKCAEHVVRDNAIKWLDNWIGHIWPGTVGTDGSKFDWSKVYDPHHGAGVDRFGAQYLRANIDPSERYVLSLPGTIKYRLDAGSSGFSNLFLAGDWIKTRMNSGCFEGAVGSGMRAARAISGFPKEIFGDDEFA